MTARDAYSTVNGQLVEVFYRRDGSMGIKRFVKHTFRLHLDVMPTGGPNQGRTYTPPPKSRRRAPRAPGR